MTTPVTNSYGPNPFKDSIEEQLFDSESDREFLAATQRVVDEQCGESYEAIRGFCSALDACAVILREAEKLHDAELMFAALLAGTRRSFAVRAAIAYEAKMEG